MAVQQEIREFDITDEQSLKEVSRILLEIRTDKIFLLKGNLGAGKTTLVQYFLKELGSKEQATSPTYSIVNTYESPKGTLHHFDLYRLNEEAELWDIGIQEYLESGNYCMIEWPEILETYWNESYPVLALELNENKRLLKLHI